MMDKHSLKVATVQYQHRAGDKPYNLQKIAAFCRQAAAQGVKLIAFPEMCISGYWHVRNLDVSEVAGLAEPVPDGEATQQLLALSASYNMVIGAGLIEATPDGAFYNTYVVALPDGRVEKHRKLHCFISEHLSSGDQYTVFNTPFGVSVGVLICYDNNIIENARITALRGADILMAPHQTGGTASRSPHAMGVIDPALWRNRQENPAAIENEFKGPKGKEWLMRWLPSPASGKITRMLSS